MQMYSRLRHKHRIKGKVIFTPDYISQELFSVVKKPIEQEVIAFEEKGIRPIIFDPCVGQGSLLLPFKKYFGDRVETLGIDVVDYEGRQGCDSFLKKDWLSVSFKDVDFSRVIFSCIHPPFADFQEMPDYENAQWKAKVNLHNRSNGFLPEIFFQRLIDFQRVPKAVLIGSMGFRLNQRMVSRRRKKFMADLDNKITGIISYPLDAFPGTSYHVEGLIWNLLGVEPHVWGARQDTTEKLF